MVSTIGSRLKPSFGHEDQLGRDITNGHLKRIASSIETVLLLRPPISGASVSVTIQIRHFTISLESSVILDSFPGNTEGRL